MKDNKDRKKAQKGTLLKVLKRIKKYSGFLILSILMAAVTVASTLYVPILVGRGKEQSYCILMYGKESKEGKERLSILAGSNDGFEIAREDLKLRGQGDFFGVMQSGDKLFSLADIYEDAPVLKAANEEAKNYAFDEITMFYKKNRRLVEKLNSYMGNVSL